MIDVVGVWRPAWRRVRGVADVAVVLFQPAPQGALPTLFAATSPDAQPGEYYGPDKFGEIRGYPTIARVPEQGLDEGVAGRLWGVSEELVGVRFGEG